MNFSALFRVIRPASLLIALAALSLFFTGESHPASAGDGGPGATTHFQQNSLYRYCDTAFPSSGLPTLCDEGPAGGPTTNGDETLLPGVSYDTTIKFDLAYGQLNFGQVVAFSPPASTVTPSIGAGGLPLGAVIGRLRSATTLGLLVAPCTPAGQDTYTLEVNLTFLNGTTNTTLTEESFSLANASSEGTLEVYRDDLNGNGLPDHVDFYPNYLNKVFDPDRNGDINGDVDEFDSFAEATAEAGLALDLNGDGDTGDAADLNGDGDTLDTIEENPGASASDPYGTVDPIVPLSRYTANQVVAGSAIELDFVQFEPGALKGFPASNPFSDFTPEMGYPTIVVLTDPNQALAPSAIHDFCSPLSTYTLAFGISKDNPCTPSAPPAGATQNNDGFGCFNDNSMCAIACGNNSFLNDPLSYCTNEADDDGDTKMNDGCPAISSPEVGAACNDNTGVGGADSDNDSDGVPDDGCPVDGASEDTPLKTTLACTGITTAKCEGGVARVLNPPAGTGILGSGTQLILNASASFRDSDADGFENNFDTCKETPDTQDGRLTRGADSDEIDPACDPIPGLDSVPPDNYDGDRTGFPLNDWGNGQDNCPLLANITQRNSDSQLPRSRSTPNGGTSSDDTGDACEGAEFGAQCTGGEATNQDGDPAIGAYAGVGGAVNDGCPARGASGTVTSAETGAACTNNTDDDAADDGLDAGGGGPFINDGCPAVDATLKALIANGHFHYHLEVNPKCIAARTGDQTIAANNPDDDNDGYCDALETALGSASSDAGNPGNQSGFCESVMCGQASTVQGAGGGAETGAQCGANAADSDGDGIVNDGCPTVIVKEANNVSGTGANQPQCQNATDDDADGAINDGCPTVDRGSCSDGVDNDGDGLTDGADAGCKTPENEAIDYPMPLANKGSGPDTNNDGIPNNDGAGPADDDNENTAPGQEEEPHQVCNDDIDQDGDGGRDAFAQLNNGGADGTGAEAGSACFGSPSDLDRDGVPNTTDNCDGTGEADRFGNFNPGQKDTDGDLVGDECDPDADGDGTSNADEWLCGSRAYSAASEIAPPCPVNVTIINPTARVTTGASPDRWADHDRDGDGWTLAQERLLGTEPNVVTGNPVDSDPCGGSTASGWGADLDPDNKLNIGDINSFTAPNRAAADFGSGGPFNTFGHNLDDDGDTIIEDAEDPAPIGPPFFDVHRWNLDLPPHLAATKIDIGDLNAINPGVDAQTSRPPMMGHGPAFFTNGGQCPFAP